MILDKPTFAFSPEQAEAIRAQVFAVFNSQSKASTAEAHQCADMCVHIVQETLLRCENVTSPIPDHRVMIAASTAAFGILSQRFNQLLEGSKQFAELTGMATHSQQIMV